MVNPKPRSRYNEHEDEAVELPVPTEYTITVSKTVQIPRFEPLVITHTARYLTNDVDDFDTFRKQAQRQLSSAVERHLMSDFKRYQKWEEVDERQSNN